MLNQWSTTSSICFYWSYQSRQSLHTVIYSPVYGRRY
jgi:hypothetical protein